MVQSLISREVDQISRILQVSLFFTFFGLTPLHVKTSDKTIHQIYNKFRQKNIEKYLKITLQQPYTLCRQPYCSVEARISRSTTTLRSTGSLDSTDKEIGIIPVIKVWKMTL